MSSLVSETSGIALRQSQKHGKNPRRLREKPKARNTGGLQEIPTISEIRAGAAGAAPARRKPMGDRDQMFPDRGERMKGDSRAVGGTGMGSSDNPC